MFLGEYELNPGRNIAFMGNFIKLESPLLFYDNILNLPSRSNYP
jgi:hypothetical protein